MSDISQPSPEEAVLSAPAPSSEPFKPVALSYLGELVVQAVEQPKDNNHERKLTVNPVVSKVASWYEKLRNAMEYREEEVILRSTIERVLRRRLLLGGNAKTTAEPLVRELIWARYLEDNSVPESLVVKVEETIDMYLSLRFKILAQRKLPESTINEWIYHLMSSHLEHVIHPEVEKETVSNFMYHILKEQVHIVDETEETRNAQVYIAIRRAFARDDIAFLQYHLFRLYFGELTRGRIDSVAQDFFACYQEAQRQLNYFAKDRIFAYVKKRTAVFLILEDILTNYKGNLRPLLANPDDLKKAVYEECDKRYTSIRSKVTRAIVRSVIFILFSKVLFAFAVEGTYENIVYGEIQWTSIIINTTIPPLLLIIVSLFIRTPGVDNSEKIYRYLARIMHEDNAKLGEDVKIRKGEEKSQPVLNFVFGLLWSCAFLVSFGGIIYVLELLHFRVISMAIFLFFSAIVSFLAYRISIIANRYRVGDSQGLVTPLVDFLFMPVVRVGRRLTEQIGRFNFLILIVDFVIETPFKVIFAFFEQWFHFLHSKREELG
jgi:hypothetical protein